MNRIGLPIVVFLFFALSFVSANCSSTQININTASLVDLDKLTGIGLSKAQAIVDARPYSTLEDLDRAIGIGPSTVSKIEQQGLACVDESIDNTPQQNTTEDVAKSLQESPESVADQTTNNVEKTQSNSIETGNTVKPLPASETDITLDPSESIINLNSDNSITTEKIIYESKNEIIRKYAIYAFAIFLILIIIILLIKK